VQVSDTAGARVESGQDTLEIRLSETLMPVIVVVPVLVTV
jgi:hypothetical protein